MNMNTTPAKRDPYDIDFTSTTAKLPWLDKITFAMHSQFAFNVSWVIFGYYLMYYYTDVVGLKPAVAGAVILFARLFDVITDPIEGYLIDNVCLKWGRYRSWPIIGVVPLCLLFVGTFTALHGAGMGVKIAWATFTYGCFGAIGATVTYSSCTGMLRNMTKNPGERALVASLQGVASSFANIVSATLFITLARYFGGESKNETKGFFVAAVIVAIVMFLVVLSQIITSRKYELNKDGSLREHLLETEHEPLLSQLKDLVTSVPVMVVVGGQVFFQIMLAIRNGVMIYVFQYYWSLDAFYTKAVFANTAAMVVGALLLKPVIKLLGDTGRAFKFVILINTILSAILYIMVLVMGPANSQSSMQYGLLFVVFVLAGVTLGTYNSFGIILLLNCIDHGEYETGRVMAGLMHASFGLAITLGSALGGFFFGLLLDGIGYVKGAALSSATQSGLLFAMFMLPAILMLIHFVLQQFYKLTDKQVAEELIEVRRRKGELTDSTLQ